MITAFAVDTKKFFHGTSDRWSSGEVIDPATNHDSYLGYGPENDPTAIYMTTDNPYGSKNVDGVDHARQYAEIAARRTGRSPHVYQVEPSGEYWPDRHSGSFVTHSPIRVVREV